MCLKFSSTILTDSAEVGRCYTGTSLHGPKSYRNFFSEKHRTGMSHGQYRSQCCGAQGSPADFLAGSGEEGLGQGGTYTGKGGKWREEEKEAQGRRGEKAR